MKLEGDLEVGIPLAEALGLDDVRLDVEITANRGDMLSHVGVVRELHPDGVHAIRLPQVPGGTAPAPEVRSDPDEASSAGVTIRIEDPDLCFRYLGLVIRGVEVGPSPDWLASRIRAAGGRPINNVVDATNYVLLELGQPLHAFDVARLEGPDIVVRRARAGEELRTLDGEDRPITEDMLMICDAERPVAIAGVMGGQDSEVTESTSDVLLECALFEPKQIRATRRALGMSTDASYRYERGVDPEVMETAILRTAEILLATAGGSVDGELIDVHPRPWSQPVVPLRPSRIEHLLGIPFTKERIAELLRPLGYSVADEDEDLLQVSVPGFRSYDTVREVDLIEEVARTHGYDAFPEELGPYRPGTVPDHPLFRLEDDLRRALVAEGLSEAQTPSLGPGEHGDVALANPMSRQESHLRRNRLAGLLTHVERNLARGTRDVRLFEIGTGFAPGDPRPVETARVAIAVTGSRSPVHWSTDREPYDVYDIGHLAWRRRVPGDPRKQDRGFPATPSGFRGSSQLRPRHPRWRDGRAGRRDCRGPAGRAALGRPGAGPRGRAPTGAGARPGRDGPATSQSAVVQPRYRVPRARGRGGRGRDRSHQNSRNGASRVRGRLRPLPGGRSSRRHALHRLRLAFPGP